MPYSGKDDPDLPSNVKDMPASDREQWVNVFNSAYNSCIADGKSTSSCEASAFKQANGVLKEKAAGMFKSLLGSLHELGVKLGLVKDRSLSVPDLYNQVAMAAYESPESYGAWLIDVYMGDSGLFALFTLNGKLYTAQVSVDTSTNSASIPAFSDWTQVKEEFTPVQAKRNFVIRESGETIRWFLIAGTTIVNRNGEIDSSALFDDMIKKCENGYSYPYLTFFHLGKQFRMGSCDYLARDGVALIASGTFDKDNPIADCMIRSYGEDPDYWGSSIGFWAVASDMVKIAQDLKLPVYTEGFLEEISILPEDYACALMTALRSTTKEVNRMDKRLEEALKKLAGDDKLAEEFIGMVDGVNRATVEEGLIHRSTEESAVEAVAEVPAPATETVPAAEEQIAGEIAETTPVVELDDSLVQQVVDGIVKSLSFTDVFAKMQESIEMLGKDIMALHSMSIKQNKEIEDRFATLERAEDEKRREWQDDASSRVINKVRVTHRPTQPEQSDQGKANYADIASSTLANLK